MAKKPTPKIKTPVHQWVNEDGEVLILRFSNADGKSFNSFQHPMEVGEAVIEPHWDPEPVCGGGIHGWPWGMGLGDGKEPDWNDGLWQVYGVKPGDITGNVGGDQKCKFKTGILRYKGDWYGAMMFILDGQKKWVEHFADGESSATGDSSASSATGYSSASSATGDSSASSATGDSSASSATGYSSASSATGDRSASSATGKASAAIVTGYQGKGMAGEYGCIALAWWNEKEQRYEMKCAETSDEKGSGGKLKAFAWYRLDEKGKFVPTTK